LSYLYTDKQKQIDNTFSLDFEFQKTDNLNQHIPLVENENFINVFSVPENNLISTKKAAVANIIEILKTAADEMRVQGRTFLHTFLCLNFFYYKVTYVSRISKFKRANNKLSQFLKFYPELINIEKVKKDSETLFLLLYEYLNGNLEKC